MLRYVGSADARSAPSATVRIAPHHAADLRIVDAPGLDAGKLDAPGASLVVVAERPGAIDIWVHPLPGSSNRDAKLSLELLSPGARPAPDSATGEGPDSASPVDGWRGSTALVEVLAHVARRGDVVADAAGWIAGPQSPSAIEGVSLRCSGADVGLAVRSATAEDGGRWSAWGPPGSFVGTRRRALPLTGLHLKLVGAGAASWAIDAEALFLGSPVLAERGAETVLASSGGGDPLVGLRVRLVPVPAPATAGRPEVRIYR